VAQPGGGFKGAQGIQGREATLHGYVSLMHIQIAKKSFPLKTLFCDDPHVFLATARF
jgi:hypothetical protein